MSSEPAAPEDFLDTITKIVEILDKHGLLPTSPGPTITENKGGCFPGELDTPWPEPDPYATTFNDTRPAPKTWHVDHFLFLRLSERHLLRLAEKLEEGWEPFAVTPGPDPDRFTYHLRRFA